MRPTVTAILIPATPGLALAQGPPGTWELSFMGLYEVDGSGDAPDPTLNAARLETVRGS